MAEYRIDEFLDMGENAMPSTYGDEVDKKVSLLYDFCILRKRKYKRPDEREDAVRELLHSYNSQTAMDSAVRGVLVGDYTLNDMLTRRNLK